MGDPPLLTGALKVTDMLAMPADALTPVGAPGIVATVNVALAAGVLSDMGLLNAPLASVYGPMTLPVTVTLKMQVVPAGIVDVVTVRLLLPGENRPDAEHPVPEIVAFGTGAFTIEAGYVSVKTTPSINVALGLVTEIVNTELLPGEINAGTKLLDTVSGDSTARSAPGAMTIPTPESRSNPGASMSKAELSNAFVTSWRVAVGFAALTKAAIAAAVGAAAEVPKNEMKPGVVVEPPSPAAKSTLLRIVPPPALNRTLPGVIAVPFGR
jgi:hypothetical protein